MAFDPFLIEDFTGSNGSVNGRTATPGGGTWTAPMFSGHTAGQIANNMFQGAGGSDRSALYSVSYGPDLQVSVTLTAVGSAVFLYARVQEAAPTPLNYYFARVVVVGAANDTLALVRVIGGAASTQATWDIGGEWAIGDAFGFELAEVATGTQYTGYRKPAAGSWASVGSGTDTNVSRPVLSGFIGLEIDATGAAVDDLSVYVLNTANAHWVFV